ncbi:Hypothetical predicted protein [Podarcis lilfordi]|uniref:Uncharacterized protein n=1 Tax=Podarcis lilfordi TaxID=74358 RepID=A0AA35KUS9_9SAUR|nr:Hypothetical predicted protein [Podarcis lilfordi]
MIHILWTAGTERAALKKTATESTTTQFPLLVAMKIRPSLASLLVHPPALAGNKAATAEENDQLPLIAIGSLKRKAGHSEEQLGPLRPHQNKSWSSTGAE